MSDITKCSGKGCPFAEKCYRYTAEANEHYQSYFADTPYIGGRCFYLIPDETMSIYDKKKIVRAEISMFLGARDHERELWLDPTVTLETNMQRYRAASAHQRITLGMMNIYSRQGKIYAVRTNLEKEAERKDRQNRDYWNNVCRIQRRQAEKGMEHYGCKLEDNDMTIFEAIQNAEEEMIDMLMYMEKLKALLKDKLGDE